MIKALLIGNQSGVEQAAQDFSKELGIPVQSGATRHNIEQSDGTLVLAADEIIGETAAIVAYVHEKEKPCLVLDLNQYPSEQLVVDWMEEKSIQTLAITGPNEGALPGIHAIAYEFLMAVFRAFPQT